MQGVHRVEHRERVAMLLVFQEVVPGAPVAMEHPVPLYLQEEMGHPEMGV